MNELRGEGVPEDRGGGSGIWSRTEQSPLGKVGAVHWRLRNGKFTELSIEAAGFPRIILSGWIPLEYGKVNLFEAYVAEFFKLGTSSLLVSLLTTTAAKARQEGEETAKFNMRMVLGLGE